MKKWIGWMLAVLLLATMGASAFAAQRLLPVTISGEIKSVTETQVRLEQTGSKHDIVLNIGKDTAIIDAVKGTKTTLSERKGQIIVAYCSAAQTMSLPPITNAYMVVCDLPQDFVAPIYAEVEEVKKSGSKTLLTIQNATMVVTLDDKTKLIPYATKNIVLPAMIKEGSRVAVWMKLTITKSMPAKATATQVVLLPAVSSDIDISAKSGSSGSMSSMMNIRNRVIDDNTKNIMATLPVFSVPNNKATAENLNNAVNDFYNVAILKLNGKNELNITYDQHESSKYISIILYREIFEPGEGSGISQVRTLVFDKQTQKVVSLESIIGKSGYASVNDQIKKQIAKNPKMYYTGSKAFKAISKYEDFYFDENNILHIIFDKYAIAFGSAGNPSFAVSLIQPQPRSSK